jgi:hypothetical protein
MHVVIGIMGMQQGLAFDQHRKLLRVLIIFNSSEVPELLVLYAPHITYKHKMETNKKQSPNSTNRTKHGQKVVLLVETIAWT